MVRKAAIFFILAPLVFAVVSCSERPSAQDTNTDSLVSIVTPWDGKTREGIVKVTVDASDAEMISVIKVFANNQLLATLSGEPYECNLNMSSYANGDSVKIYACAIDTDNRETNSSAVTIYRGHTTTPVITAFNATPTSVKQGEAVTLSVSATDSVTALPPSAFTWTSSLQGRLDPNSWTDTQTADNFTFRGLVIGTHTITVTAANANGVTADTTITVTVAANNGKYAYIPSGTYSICQPVFAKSTVIISRPVWFSKTEMTMQEFYTYLTSYYVSSALARTPAVKTGYKDAMANAITPKKTALSALGYPAVFDTVAGVSATMKYPNYPAMYVTYKEACSVCNQLSVVEGLTPVYAFTFIPAITKYPHCVSTITMDMTATGYRLPTEAEWEVAARGGLVGKKYPWGDDNNDPAAYKENTRSVTNMDNRLVFLEPYGPAPVMSGTANAFGIFDMAGNVSEFVADQSSSVLPSGYDPDYLPFCDTVNDFAKAYFLAKGGNWNSYLGDAMICGRTISLPFPTNSAGLNYYSTLVGLRVVRNAL